MTNGIIILGNGGGGTSLLRGLLHAHSWLHIEFEYGRTLNLSPAAELDNWIEQAEQCPLIWGNKVPIEQFKTREWMNEDIFNIIDHFKIVWLARRLSKYVKPQNKHNSDYWKQVWKWGQWLYWGLRELHPERIIQISFEDLLLRTEDELKRICGFLEIQYLPEMLQGTNNTGYKKYDQAGINLEKV